MTELLSTRTAIEELAAAGCNHLAAREILASGLAGPATVTRGAVLYAADRVRAIGNRSHANPTALAEHTALAGGVFVVRLRARRTVEETAPPRTWIGFDATQPNSPEQDDALRMWWTMSESTAETIRQRCDREGFVPLVATVGTLVATGRNIIAVDDYVDNQIAFIVTPAGPWFADHFADHWLNAGRGASWKWWTT